jgi:DNA-binding PadR family transcriptional regulator
MERSLINSDLTLFSYEVLALVGRGGVGPHDLRRMVERGRMVAWAGESQYYTEPKRLAALGYLASRKEPGRTRERTVYTLTDRGREALASYAQTPVTVLPIRSDALLRLLMCDLVGEQVTLESLTTLRADVADLGQGLEEVEQSARDLPHREKYLLLTAGFLRRFLELHLELVDEVERQFAERGSGAGATGVDRTA